MKVLKKSLLAAFEYFLTKPYLGKLTSRDFPESGEFNVKIKK
jgi:hypothetical protein